MTEPTGQLSAISGSKAAVPTPGSLHAHAD
jgi:hypothetical protein